MTVFPSPGFPPALQFRVVWPKVAVRVTGADEETILSCGDPVPAGVPLDTCTLLMGVGALVPVTVPGGAPLASAPSPALASAPSLPLPLSSPEPSVTVRPPLPTRSASKNDWTAWGIDHGGLSASAALGMNRDDLITTLTALAATDATPAAPPAPVPAPPAPASPMTGSGTTDLTAGDTTSTTNTSSTTSAVAAAPTDSGNAGSTLPPSLPVNPGVADDPEPEASATGDRDRVDSAGLDSAGLDSARLDSAGVKGAAGVGVDADGADSGQ